MSSAKRISPPSGLSLLLILVLSESPRFCARRRGDLDAGNSGSTIRMLSGILAAQPFGSRIFGDESLSRRPMQRIVKPLGEMGARIRARQGKFPPLDIEGGRLRRMGVEAEEWPDGMTIPGRQRFRTAEFDSFGDHRIAMAFAVAALWADGESVIDGAEAASVSFPEFWQTLGAIS
jgi:5-enolpyruvylshikimate-3-phosphate synthase